jgi:methyltransferase (TIGR00027 family)
LYVADHRIAVPLPARPNLDQQRKRARALLKAARAQNRDALERFRAVRPNATDEPLRLSLQAAQFVIAREYGLSSWTKLKSRIEAKQMSPLAPVALVNAANRALETEYSRPLYRDPFARALAGEAGMAWMVQMRSAWGTASGPPSPTDPQPLLSIRTKFFDDALQNAVRSKGIQQVVVLGAGMDTRAFRLDWPARLAWFEIDRDEVFDRKEPVLRRLVRPRCERRSVRADLGADWTKALLAAGFDPTRPAAFLIEGLLVYLRTATVGQVLRAAHGIASAGSWLGLDLVSAATAASPLMTAHLRKLAELGWPTWESAVDDPETFLAEHGWRARSVIAGSPQASFGRWRYPYTPREAPGPGIPRAFLVEGQPEVRQ